MSSKKIVAATITAVALGLAFAGYLQVTRANDMEDPLERASFSRVKSDAGYRANHQIGHSGAVFTWMDAAANWNQSPKLHTEEEPVIGQCLIPSKDEELTPVRIRYAARQNEIGRSTESGSGDGTNEGQRESRSLRYASANFGGFGGLGMIGGSGGGGGAGGSASHGASGNDNSNGSSGSADPNSGKPSQDAPANGGSNDQPGSADPNPPAGEQQQDPPVIDEPVGPPDPPANPVVEKQPGPPSGEGTGEPTKTQPDPSKEVHEVPEPATLGLMGLGLFAAAALRRRRRS